MGNAVTFDHVLARELVEAAPDGLFITDGDGTIVAVNPAGAALFGWPREELLGKPVVTLIPEDGNLHLTIERSSTPRSGLIARGRRRDGSELPVEISLGVIETGHGRLFLASIRDISDRQRTLNALQVAEERLRQAQKVARIGNWDWDLRTNTVYRSPELLDLYGFADEDAPALALTNLIPEEERQGVVAAITEAIRAGRSYSIEHRVIRPDGKERVFLEQGETTLHDGVPVRSFGTTQDITELRTVEREKAAALAEIETLLEECPVGITIVRGPAAAQMEANRHARMMQGEFDPKSGLGQFRGSLLTTDGLEVGFDRFPAIRALLGERVEREEYVFQRPDGRAIPIEVKAVPIADAQGTVTSAVVVWEDLSTVKEIERLRAEWNSVVAHDLRQPINTINLYAQLLSRAAEKGAGSWPADVLEHVREIRKMIGRLARMTNDLLDLSRLDASRLSVERRPIDLTACVRESVAHAALQSPDHKLDVRVDDEIPIVDADPDRLAQVMENLLTNAIKYGHASAPIRVSVERAEESVAVAVTSKGDAIEPRDLERIFERFERAGVAAHRAIPGIGLGLQITQGLVLAHGGRIGATSNGGETTFRFTIPLRRAEQERP